MCDASEPGPLRSLPILDGVILWTMRAWVIGLTQRIPVEEQIHNAFVRLDAPDATGQLFGFMWVLGSGACRTLAVDCVCKPDVSADERALLDILALSQHGRSFEALLLLRSMVRPKVAIAAQDASVRVTAALTAAGRFLTPRQTGTSRHVLASERWNMETGQVFRTLH